MTDAAINSLNITGGQGKKRRGKEREREKERRSLDDANAETPWREQQRSYSWLT